MCMVRNAAIAMVNSSVEIAKNRGDQYYISAIKLHKLLYLAQGYMLTVHNTPLFVEEIEAHDCGPFVPGIDFVADSMGYGEIRRKFDTNEFGLSFRRMAVVNKILERYGALPLKDLVNLSMETEPYVKIANTITETNKPFISQDSMKDMSLFYTDKEAVDKGIELF